MPLNFARQAFGREKPHSSITDWVDILTGPSFEEEAYDCIPELVDSINLQASGPAEACRALRKKLKHGNVHQQYRALVLLKALVENCGVKFQNTFSDVHMTDAIRNLYNDYQADKRVRKKLALVLASWRDQYEGDPSMSIVAGLYKHCRGNEKGRIGQQELAQMMGLTLTPEEKRRAEREDAKMRARFTEEDKPKGPSKEAHRSESEARQKKRVPFDFEKDKPKVLSTIVEASQASSNLMNAIALVNPKHDSLESNERVQECLDKAKQARKLIVRYIQLVENEELIGTLIETNDRVMNALDTYDKLCIVGPADDGDESDGQTAAATTAMASARISHDKGKARQEGNIFDPDSPPLHVHPDLEDLNFEPVFDSRKLPAPMRPSNHSEDDDFSPQRPSLSEFSDYESSDEGKGPKKHDGPSRKRSAPGLNEADTNDPFADPFR